MGVGLDVTPERSVPWAPQPISRLLRGTATRCRAVRRSSSNRHYSDVLQFLLVCAPLIPEGLGRSQPPRRFASAARRGSERFNSRQRHRRTAWLFGIADKQLRQLVRRGRRSARRFTPTDSIFDPISFRRAGLRASRSATPTIGRLVEPFGRTALGRVARREIRRAIRGCCACLDQTRVQAWWADPPGFAPKGRGRVWRVSRGPQATLSRTVVGRYAGTVDSFQFAVGATRWWGRPVETKAARASGRRAVIRRVAFAVVVVAACGRHDRWSVTLPHDRGRGRRSRSTGCKTDRFLVRPGWDLEESNRTRSSVHSATQGC